MQIDVVREARLRMENPRGNEPLGLCVVLVHVLALRHARADYTGAQCSMRNYRPKIPLPRTVHLLQHTHLVIKVLTLSSSVYA